MADQCIYPVILCTHKPLYLVETLEPRVFARVEAVSYTYLIYLCERVRYFVDVSGTDLGSQTVILVKRTAAMFLFGLFPF